jgi:AraC-like DNA-binding protein
VLRPASDIDAFLRAPHGRYLAGPHHFVWCASPSLVGSCHWGRLEGEEMLRMLRFLDLGASLAPPIDIYMDGKDVVAWDDTAFAQLVTTLTERRDELSHLIKRQAVVLAPGLPGAVMAGIKQLAVGGFDLRFFEEREPALKWLVPAEVRAHIDEVAREVRGQDAFLRALHAALAQELDHATLDSVAAALRTSTRSLQRELRNRDTSFRQELQRARVAAAERLLADPTAKVEAVARAVGCASSSHLATLFRRHRGHPPRKAPP